MVTIDGLGHDRGAVARSILAALPEWFGRPDSLDAYVRAADDLDMLVARTADGTCVGFLSLKKHTAVAVEAYVLGVDRTHHRQGIGRALFEYAARHLAGQGYRFLTVKTLAADHPSPHYAATRRFYEAIGFEPVEIFPTLWDSATPCLLMVMPLSRDGQTDASRHVET